MQIASYAGIGGGFTMSLESAEHTETVGLVTNYRDGDTVVEGFENEFEGRKEFYQVIQADLVLHMDTPQHAAHCEPGACKYGDPECFGYEEEEESVIQGVALQGTDSTLTLAQRVRQIADMDHPWIPGSQADLIREIAAELESRA